MILSKLYSAVLPRIKHFPQRISYQLGKQSIRHGGDKRVLRIYTSTMKDRNFYKWVGFYLALGAFPAALIIFYTSVFIGDAELYDYDPELYEPKYWEMYKHPLSQFIGKYFMEDPKLSYYKDIYAIEVQAHQGRAKTLIYEVETLERMRGRRPFNQPKERQPHKGVLKDMDEYAEREGIERTREE